LTNYTTIPSILKGVVLKLIDGFMKKPIVGKKAW